MKQSILSDTPSNFNKVTLDKILAIEKDVMALKLTVLKKVRPSGKKVLKLQGIMKGIIIDEDDITEAKKGLYGRIPVKKCCVPRKEIEK